jgi:hypothetical protein
MLISMAIESELSMLISEIEANASHLETITHGLSNAQFNWRPEAGRWSMAECIGHLNLVNGKDVAPLEAAIAAGRARNLTGEGPFTYGLLSRKFVANMDAPATRKFKAPKSYLPPPEAEMAATLAEYRRISGEMRRLAQSARGLDLARVKTTLPALPAPLRAVVRMPLGARLELLTAHDRRHLWQAEQVRQHPRFPPA